MTSGRFYMHKNAMDACIAITKSYYIRSKKLWSVKATWINIGYMGEPWPLGVTHRMNLKFDEWIDVSHTMYNKRTQSGVPT